LNVSANFAAFLRVLCGKVFDLGPEREPLTAEGAEEAAEFAEKFKLSRYGFQQLGVDC
jgi:hypothetical protein